MRRIIWGQGNKTGYLRLPNRAAPGSPLTAEERRQIDNAVGFTFDSSEGNSIYHAVQLRVIRRLRRGLSSNIFYTFSKSIDNASSIGGAGTSLHRMIGTLRRNAGRPSSTSGICSVGR